MALSLHNFDTDDLFPYFFPRLSGADKRERGSSARYMPLDIVEKDETFEVAADIPGVQKENISISVEQDVLRISVKQTKEEERDIPTEGGKHYHVSERGASWSSRSIRMPDTANLDEIAACYVNGVLQLTIGKKAPTRRQVAIN